MTMLIVGAIVVSRSTQPIIRYRPLVQAVEFWTRAAVVSPLTGRWITHIPHSHAKPTAKLHGPKLYFSSFPRPGRSASADQGIRHQDHQDEQAAKSSRSSAPHNTNP